MHHQPPPTIHQPRHTAPRGRKTKKQKIAHRVTAKTGSQRHNFSKGKEIKKGKNAQLKPAYTTNNQNAREAETTLKKKACSPAWISRRWRRKKPSPTPGTHSADSKAGQRRVKTQPGDRLLRVRRHHVNPQDTPCAHVQKTKNPSRRHSNMPDVG